MKVEYINPFVTASFRVMEAVLGTKPEKGALEMRNSIFTSQQCNVITGVTGMIEGHVIYGMSLLTADKIASQMLGHTIRTFDQMAASAIAELGNMVTGNAMALLSEAGYVCDITPPSILRGSRIKISTVNIPALVVPICLRAGVLELTVSLQQR